MLRQICFQAAAARFVSVAGCSWPVVVQTSGRRRTACRNSGTGISGVAILARYVRCADSVGSRRPAVLPTRPVPARGNSLSPAPLPGPPPHRPVQGQPAGSYIVAAILCDTIIMLSTTVAHPVDVTIIRVYLCVSARLNIIPQQLGYMPNYVGSPYFICFTFSDVLIFRLRQLRPIPWPKPRPTVHQSFL